MVKVYTTPSCNGCRKAKKWLRENSVNFVEKNITSHKLIRSEVLDILKYTVNGFEDIISKRSNDYEKIAERMDEMKFNDLVEFIIDNPKILKRPILVSDEENISIGYNVDDIRIMLPKKKREVVLRTLDDCENCDNNDETRGCTYAFSDSKQ